MKRFEFRRMGRRDFLIASTGGILKSINVLSGTSPHRVPYRGTDHRQTKRRSRRDSIMGGSRAGSVGSYSSGSASVGDVLGKYGTNAADGTIAKVRKDGKIVLVNFTLRRE